MSSPDEPARCRSGFARNSSARRWYYGRFDSDDAATLSEMLVNWGYLREENADEVQDILQSYIERD